MTTPHPSEVSKRHRRQALSCLVKAAAAVAEREDHFGREGDELLGFALAMTAGALLHLAQADDDRRGLANAEAIIASLRGAA